MKTWFSLSKHCTYGICLRDGVYDDNHILIIDFTILIFHVTVTPHWQPGLIQVCFTSLCPKVVLTYDVSSILRLVSPNTSLEPDSQCSQHLLCKLTRIEHCSRTSSTTGDVFPLYCVSAQSFVCLLNMRTLL